MWPVPALGVATMGVIVVGILIAALFVSSALTLPAASRGGVASSFGEHATPRPAPPGPDA